MFDNERSVAVVAVMAAAAVAAVVAVAAAGFVRPPRGLRPRQRAALQSAASVLW